MAREGGLLDVGGGEMRPLESFDWLGKGHTYALSTSNGEAVGFNDAGQLAFVARFAGGDNAIVIATVPEPGAAAMVAMAGMAAWAALGRGRVCQRQS
jgi:hypothetical protein